MTNSQGMNILVEVVKRGNLIIETIDLIKEEEGFREKDHIDIK